VLERMFVFGGHSRICSPSSSVLNLLRQGVLQMKKLLEGDQSASTMSHSNPMEMSGVIN